MSYRQRPLGLLEKSRPQAAPYPTSVAKTWLLNFYQVEEASPAAADLLRAFAFLAPAAIPRELIELGADELGEALLGALWPLPPLRRSATPPPPKPASRDDPG